MILGMRVLDGKNENHESGYGNYDLAGREIKASIGRVVGSIYYVHARCSRFFWRSVRLSSTLCEITLTSAGGHARSNARIN